MPSAARAGAACPLPHIVPWSHHARFPALVLPCDRRLRPAACEQGNSSWTHYHGNTRPGTPAGAAVLADENIAELTGQHPQIEAAEWAQRVRFEGRVMRPTNTDSVAAMLALHSARDLPAQVRELADALQEAGEIPPDPLDT
jgi:hypothetical protein